MSERLFILRGWGAAFLRWLRESHDNAYRARKQRQERARREMERVLGWRR